MNRRTTARGCIASVAIAAIAVVLAACTGTPPSPSESVPSSSAPLPSASESPQALPASEVPAPTASARTDRAGSMLRVQAAGVRMRAEPSTSAELILALPAGATVSRTDADAVEADELTWYEVRADEETGWVASGPEGDWLASVTNGRIGFACTSCGDGGSRAAATVGPDGSDRQILLSEFGWPTWSPDGTRVVIEYTEPGSFESNLVLASADGSDAEALGAGSGAAWSPDGEWLAFSNHSAGTLVVIDPDGRRFDLTVNDFGAPDALAWAPDSSRLALVAIDCDGCPTDEPLMGDVPRGIFVFTPPMGSVDRVVEGGFYGGLTWSADGSSLTYSWTDLSSESGVRRVDLADGTVTALTSDPALLEGWAFSPDGTRMAAQTPDGIVVADPNGADAQIVVSGTQDSNPRPTNPRWSPDSRWILYDMEWITGDAIDSWMVPADGSDEPRLVSEDAYRASWQRLLVQLSD